MLRSSLTLASSSLRGLAAKHQAVRAELAYRLAVQGGLAPTLGWTAVEAAQHVWPQANLSTSIFQSGVPGQRSRARS